VRINQVFARALLATGLALALTGTQAYADTPAMSFSSASLGFSTNQTLGWTFTANTPGVVDALGYYDLGGDGLAVSHDVGIWDNLGNLLTSTTVASGTVDPLISSFRYATIAPITLTPGQMYTIGATTDTIENPAGFDFWGYNLVGLTTDPAITIPPGAGRFIPTVGNALVFPTLTGDSQAYAGPNFLLGASPSDVPEPGSLALVATGALPLLGLVRRKRVQRRI
jgi:hypothetical protein